MKLKEVYLNSIVHDDRQSLGVLYLFTGADIFVAKSLELPWNDNKPQISCIPAGRYLCKRTWSPKHGEYQHEICNVPGRTGLRFDIANFVKQLLGCVCLGDAYKDINLDGNLDVIHSGETIRKFRELVGEEDFWLNVNRILPS